MVCLRAAIGILGTCALAACVPLEQKPAEGAEVAPSEDAPDAPRAADILAVTPEQASSAGLVESNLEVPVTDDSDGSRMVATWLDAVRRRGSTRVGTIAVHVVRTRDEGTVECVSTLYPKNATVPVTIPPSSHAVPVTRAVERPVFHTEQQCSMVSRPHTRMVTTYTMQYDSFSKSTRSVPQNQMVTEYQMQNECHTQLVSRLETQYEYATEWRYSPPRVELLDKEMLKESAPSCEVTSDPMAVSRVVGVVYDRDDTHKSADDPANACHLAFLHIRELVQAWSGWYPERAPKPAPSLSEFLGACRVLSKPQQACLVMPFGKTRRSDCEPYLAGLTQEQREGLDEVLSEPRTRP
jgi:hypothetical protein